MTLTIDPEFEALIPPLVGREREQLRRAIDAEGVRDPILTWTSPGKKATPLIVDGHNRYRIAQELGQDVPDHTPCKVLIGKTREEVKAWILTNQIARRNLSQDQITILFVSRGADPPNNPTPLQLARAQAVCADGRFVERVLRGEWTLRQAAGVLQPPTPRPAAAPRGNPDRAGEAPPSPAPVGAAPVGASTDEGLREARARAEASRAVADVKALQRRLLEAEKAEEFYTSIASAPPIKVSASRPKSGKRQGTICTCASDWHIGERVTAEETHGRNVYDLKVARERAARFWDNVLWLRKDITRTVESPDHVLNLNGDLISGSIHEELTETNEVPLVEQASECIATLEPGIRALSKEVPGRLIIPCTHGNHGRWTAKSRIKTGWANSLESMVYRQLRDRCRDLPNVEWVIPRAESVSFECMGLRLRFQHGTHIRSQGGIGGILVPLTRWATRQNTADLYIFGHFHQACAFGKVIVNGSLIGASAFTEELGFEYRPPEQINWVIDAQHGVRRFDPVSVT